MDGNGPFSILSTQLTHHCTKQKEIRRILEVVVTFITFIVYVKPKLWWDYGHVPFHLTNFCLIFLHVVTKVWHICAHDNITKPGHFTYSRSMMSLLYCTIVQTERNPLVYRLNSKCENLNPKILINLNSKIWVSDLWQINKQINCISITANLESQDTQMTDILYKEWNTWLSPVRTCF